MKLILITLFSTLILVSNPLLQAETSPYEQAVTDKAALTALSALSDKDLAAYCISNNVRSKTLGQLTADMASTEVDLKSAASAGLRVGNPKMDALNTNLMNLRIAYDKEIRRVRDGLRVDLTIAQNIISNYTKANPIRPNQRP